MPNELFKYEGGVDNAEHVAAERICGRVVKGEIPALVVAFGWRQNAKTLMRLDLVARQRTPYC